MAVGYNPRIVTDGLVLALDAGNPKNYNAGISTNWTDKVGGNNGTLVGGTHHNDGPFVGAGYVEFDGTGDYLSITDSTDFDFGSGDFTIEFFLYSASFSDYTGILGKRNAETDYAPLLIGTDNSAQKKIRFLTSTTGSSWISITSSSAFPLSQWVHVAVVRSGSTITLYENGVSKGSASISGSVISNSVPVVVGATSLTISGSVRLNGFLSNLRILKGTALYTSNFTPPTKPLTAVTNTKLLTCQGNTIADASSSAHTITANGDISLTKEPFAGAGAVDFGGSADGLYTPNITLGSNDWTLEFWIYLTSTGTARGLYSYFLTTTTARQISYSIDSSNQFGWQHRLNDGTYPSAAGSTALSAHTWYHVAAVRVNDDYYTYINGVQDSSYTSAPAGHTYYADGVPHYIGYNRTGTSDFDGLLSNVRFVNGTALYTSNFTPPAEPLTAVTNTELLTCQGQNINDASSNAHAITVNGDAKATIVSSSFEFDGTDDYVDVGSTNIPAGPLTVSAWINLSSEVSIATIAASNGDWIFGTTSRKPFAYNYASAAQTTAPSGHALSIGVWYNVVMVQGSSLDVYINGSLSATNSDGTDMTATEDLDIGRRSGNNDRYHHGKIADLKIYSKALTAAEVTQNYNATKGRYV